ncbi:Tigger transposable element-derived protein 6 [Dictyocoela muelleri]|nr:Tigger transposable element-derived protein 6 [Dictyocoela muelleri]
MIENKWRFITELLLKAKAIDFYKISYPDSNSTYDKKEFTASNGWINRFRGRHKLNLRKFSGESFEIKKNNYNNILDLFKEKISQYGEDNIFNRDETAFFYKHAPQKVYISSKKCNLKKGYYNASM